MSEKLYRVNEAANILAVSVRSVWRLISKGELEAVRPAGMKATRVVASSIVAMIERVRDKRSR